MRRVWIFGYGSLIWRPGFEHEACMVGYIKGFERVFYQGNDKHRGSPQRSEVWGRAFLVTTDENSRTCPLAYLDTREAKHGGYATLITTFYPKAMHQSPVEALLYVALPSNSLYLGPKSYPDMAREIVSSHGECGSNAEYVLNIADFMREEVHGVDDEHLFMLEMHVLSELQHWTGNSHSFRAKVESGRSFCSALPHASNPAYNSETTSSGSSKATNKSVHEGEAANEDFSSTVSARKSRCVDI